MGPGRVQPIFGMYRLPAWMRTWDGMVKAGWLGSWPRLSRRMRTGGTTCSSGGPARRRTTGRPMWPCQVAEALDAVLALFCNLLRDGRARLAEALARLRDCAARNAAAARFRERRRLA